MHNCEDDKAQAKVSEAVNGRSSAVECLASSNYGGQERTQYISNMHSHEYLCMLRVVYFWVFLNIFLISGHIFILQNTS